VHSAPASVARAFSTALFQIIADRRALSLPKCDLGAGPASRILRSRIARKHAVAGAFEFSRWRENLSWSHHLLWRKAGELLRMMEKAKGGRPWNQPVAPKRGKAPTRPLSDKVMLRKI